MAHKRPERKSLQSAQPLQPDLYATTAPPPDARGISTARRARVDSYNYMLSYNDLNRLDLLPQVSFNDKDKLPGPPAKPWPAQNQDGGPGQLHPLVIPRLAWC